jgi:hypothetical protein
MQQNTRSDISKFVSSEKNEDSYNDMYEAGMLLPTQQRARMAQYYYQRVHLRNLGLRLIATCEFHIIKQLFGAAGEVIYNQALDLTEE